MSAGDIVVPVADAFRDLAAPGGGLYWLHLASALVLALLVYWWRDARHGPPTITGFLRFCFPARIYRHRSSRLDLRFFFVNTALCGLVVAPLLATSAGVSGAVVGALVALFGIPEAAMSFGRLGAVGLTVAAVLAADLGFFVSHRLRHTVPVLWEFHKIHHAAEVLQPLTAYRLHPVDRLLNGTLMGAGTGIVLGVAAYLCGRPVEPLSILGVNAVVFVFLAAGSHLRHSHVWLSYGPVLERVFVSPAMHQIHHSREPRHLGRNLGGIFALWDWITGTLYVPEGRETFALGLKGGAEARRFTGVARLYLLPFLAVARRAAAAARRAEPRLTTDEEAPMTRFRHAFVPTLAVAALVTAASLALAPGSAGQQKLKGYGAPDLGPTAPAPEVQGPQAPQAPQPSTPELAPPPSGPGEATPKLNRPGAAAPSGYQVLTTIEGTRIFAFDDGGAIGAAKGAPPSGPRVADGLYRLKNGGAVRVRDGRIVWDAFGKVQRFLRGDLARIPPGMG